MRAQQQLRARAAADSRRSLLARRQAAERTKRGELAPNATTFPSGMRALSDRVHAMGLQFGIYSSAGFKTCQGLPASLGHEKQDAASFAAWGVDLLKYDNCFSDGTKPEVRYPVMRDALNATGRRVFYALCEWGVDGPAAWAREVGNSWRTTIDIEDTWLSVQLNLELSAGLADAAGPGGWNDMDMLEVGNGGLSAAEERAHFSLWAALKSPLLLGCDLTTADAATLQLVSNPEVIAVSQDARSAQARRVWSSAPGAASALAFRHVADAEVAGAALWREGDYSLAGARAVCALGGTHCIAFTLASESADPEQRVRTRVFSAGAPAPDAPANTTAQTYMKCGAATDVDWREVWAGPLADGAVAVVLFNRDAHPQCITARWADIGLCDAQPARVRDLWRREHLGTATGNFTATVEPHGALPNASGMQVCNGADTAPADVVMLRVTPEEPLLQCDDAAPPASAAVPAGVWGLAWREVVRSIAPVRDALT